ncbi:acyltransferase [Limosilactobacillus fermentum]|uniref:acyltransferase family protein n=1 Tax=Limosilactobacillus fermentum TaxID=1613 RepID=UPI0021A8844D|nr:acyltransferase [Limosilactobacillus fermentum]MCT3457517.1 acyltransferase [Limosilactobacillus fermentum]
MEKHRKRIEWVDFGKGFTIFLVVITHCLNGYWDSVSRDQNIAYVSNSLLLIIMPIFFSLAGFVFNHPKNMREYIKMVRAKAISLLIPYTIFSIILNITKKILGVNVGLGEIIDIWYKPIEYLWFLYILFFVFVVVGLLYTFRVNSLSQMIIYILIFCSIQFYGADAYILKSFGWAIFFVLGVILKQNIKLLSSIYFITISGVIFVISYLMLYRYVGYNYDYDQLSLINIIPKLSVDMFCISIFANLSIKSMFFKYFQSYGKRSMIIYLIHPPVISAVIRLFVKLHIVNSVILIFVSLILTWGTSIAVVKLTNKVNILQFVFNPYAKIRQYL